VPVYQAQRDLRCDFRERSKEFFRLSPLGMPGARRRGDAGQTVNGNSGSPTSRPRQLASTHPCTARAHSFVSQDSSFKAAFPVVELTAHWALKGGWRRNAPVTHQARGFSRGGVAYPARFPLRPEALRILKSPFVTSRVTALPTHIAKLISPRHARQGRVWWVRWATPPQKSSTPRRVSRFARLGTSRPSCANACRLTR
jgi:hypothetical protein